MHESFQVLSINLEDLTSHVWPCKSSYIRHHFFEFQSFRDLTRSETKLLELSPFLHKSSKLFHLHDRLRRDMDQTHFAFRFMVIESSLCKPFKAELTFEHHCFQLEKRFGHLINFLGDFCVAWTNFQFAGFH